MSERLNDEDVDFFNRNSQSLLPFGSYMSSDEYFAYFLQQLLKNCRSGYPIDSEEYNRISGLITTAEELAKEKGIPPNLGAFEESILSLMGEKNIGVFVTISKTQAQEAIVLGDSSKALVYTQRVQKSVEYLSRNPEL